MVTGLLGAESQHWSSFSRLGVSLHIPHVNTRVGACCPCIRAQEKDQSPGAVEVFLVGGNITYRSYLLSRRWYLGTSMHTQIYMHAYNKKNLKNK